MVDVERLLKGQASLPPAPTIVTAEAANGAPRRPNDNKISDVWRREDLPSQNGHGGHAQQCPKSSRNEEGRKLGVAKKELVRINARCDASEAKQKALEAQLASAVKESHMKRNIVIVALIGAVGYLGWNLYNTQTEMDDFKTAYVNEVYGNPDALAGKKVLEITPFMQELGVDKFVGIAGKLPCADTETIDGLFNEGVDSVQHCWGWGCDAGQHYPDYTVVQLQNHTKNARWTMDPPRTVFIHVAPASLMAYAKAWNKDRQDNRLRQDDFAECYYGVMGPATLHTVGYVSTLPTATHKELAALSGQHVIMRYDDQCVLFLSDRYGTNEKFVHLAPADYQALAAGRVCDKDLMFMNYDWWRDNIASHQYVEKLDRISCFDWTK